MTKYTDDQINEAIQKAAAKNTPGPVYAWELSMYKKVIDALPEPQDDWQECEFSDLRKGDRVRLEFADITHEAEVKTVRKNEIVIGGNNNFTLYRYKNPKIFRVPSPVQHPDPEEHPVIIVRESTVLPKGSEPQKVMFIRPYYRNDIWNGAPDTITDWSPAKVVADE